MDESRVETVNTTSEKPQSVCSGTSNNTDIANVLMSISDQDDQKWLLDSIIGFIRNVEQKTSILFAVIGVFAGFIVTNSAFAENVSILLNNPGDHVMPAICLALCTVTLVSALGLFVAIMIARLKGSDDSNLYFASIASKTVDSFSEKMLNGIDPNDLAGQIHINACICEKKYKLYNKCVVASASAIAFCVLFLVLMMLGA